MLFVVGLRLSLIFFFNLNKCFWLRNKHRKCDLFNILVVFFLICFSVMRYREDGRAVGTSVKDNLLLSEGLDGYLGGNASPGSLVVVPTQKAL